MARQRTEFLLTDLLVRMVDIGASDLHLKAGSPAVFRVNGRLIRSPFMVESDSAARDLVFSTLKEAQIARLEANLELDYAYELKGVARFRANAFFQQGTLSASFRTIPLKIPTIEDLGLPQICREISSFPHGLVLVCGPTGCGKSTTLAAIINHINSTRSCRVITIEDPIEYLYAAKSARIVQRERGRDTREVSSALRETLRQDPDVILVGEMRDLETISLALTAAETGHLVFATLHTQNAAKNIDRIIDVFQPAQQQQIRLQVSQTLRAVLSQTLVPRLDGSGRVPAVEIMVVNNAISNLIREQKVFQIKNVIQTSTKNGMRTLDQALGELVAKNFISLDEASTRCEVIEEVMEAISKIRRGEFESGRPTWMRATSEQESQTETAK